jgi:hypothetical protein
VVQDAATCQAMSERIQQVEEELRALKLEVLRREIDLGLEQLKSGDHVEFDDDSLPILLENIKFRGRKRLGQSS